MTIRVKAVTVAFVALCALALGGTTSARAQAPDPGQMDRPPDKQVTIPGGELKPLPRQITFGSSIGSVKGMHAFSPGSLDFLVQGPSGFEVTLASVESMKIPGVGPSSGLFQLVDTPSEPTSTSGTAPASAGSGGQSTIVAVADPRIIDVDMNRESSITPIVTLKKRLVYKGLQRSALANPDTFFRAIDVVLSGHGGNATSKAKTITFVLTADDAAPQVVNSSAASASEQGTGDFPSIVDDGGQEGKTFRLNFVNVHSRVDVDVTDFTVRITNRFAAPGRLRDFYKAIVVYDDGARFACNFTAEVSTIQKATKVQILVPNIDRGGYKVQIVTPFGVSESNKFSFPPNLFETNIPVSVASLTGVNVDTPTFAATEDLFWPPVVFDPPALASSRSCGEIHGEWVSVTVGKVDVTPVGVASAKITRNPTAGSLAHNGNMPKFTCSSAGLGTVRVRWTAKMRMYVGECSQFKVPD